jgi:hypothetical protein
LKKKLIYKLKVLLGYQRIFDRKGVETLEGGGGVKGNKRFYEGGRWRCAL